MGQAALRRLPDPEEERWEPFEYHGEEWIADLEQSWLASLRNNLADWLLSRGLPDTPPAGPRVASHRLSGSELYLHDLLEAVRLPWWRTFKEDLGEFCRCLVAREPAGPGLELSQASQHIRSLVPGMQRSLVHSLAVECRHILVPQKLTPEERIAAKRPKYHPPLDVMGIVIAIAWQAFIIGVALTYSAVHPHAEAKPKLVKWPTTPIYFVPPPRPVEEESGAKLKPAVAAPAPVTAQPRQAVVRRLEPVHAIPAAPVVEAAAPAVAPPRVDQLNSMPALPTGLPAAVSGPAGPASAPAGGSGGGGIAGSGVVAGGGVARAGGIGTGTGTGPKGPERIRVSSLSRGSLVRDVAPVYPHAAQVAHIAGDVILRAVIGKDGAVKEVTVVSGNPVLLQAAIDAVRQRRYRPPTLNGAPVEVETEVTISFGLK